MNAAKLAPVLQNVGGLGLALLAFATADGVEGMPTLQPAWLVVLSFVAGWLVRDPQTAARWLVAVRAGKLPLQQPAEAGAPAPVTGPDDLTPVESIDELERAAGPTPRPPGP